MSQQDNEYLDGKQAVEYLRELWGLPSYSEGAFRALRFRLNIEPDLKTHASTFWLRSTLKLIPKPDRSKPRGPRSKKEEASEETGRVGKVMCKNTGLTARLPDLVA